MVFDCWNSIVLLTFKPLQVYIINERARCDTIVEKNSDILIYVSPVNIITRTLARLPNVNNNKGYCSNR